MAVLTRRKTADARRRTRRTAGMPRPPAPGPLANQSVSGQRRESIGERCVVERHLARRGEHREHVRHASGHPGGRIAQRHDGEGRVLEQWKRWSVRCRDRSGGFCAQHDVPPQPMVVADEERASAPVRLRGGPRPDPAASGGPGTAARSRAASSSASPGRHSGSPIPSVRRVDDFSAAPVLDGDPRRATSHAAPGAHTRARRCQ